MKQTIDLYQFRNAFQSVRPENFSYEGLEALFNWLEELEEAGEQETELDVIAICCEFTEYENLKEFQDNYGDDYPDIEAIQDKTSVIMVDDDSFIIQDF
jgi:hypothetical protein